MLNDTPTNPPFRVERSSMDGRRWIVSFDDQSTAMADLMHGTEPGEKAELSDAGGRFIARMDYAL
jgi:hypothetical protein